MTIKKSLLTLKNYIVMFTVIVKTLNFNAKHP